MRRDVSHPGPTCCEFDPLDPVTYYTVTVCTGTRKASQSQHTLAQVVRAHSGDATRLQLDAHGHDRQGTAKERFDFSTTLLKTGEAAEKHMARTFPRLTYHPEQCRVCIGHLNVTVPQSWLKRPDAESDATTAAFAGLTM